MYRKLGTLFRELNAQLKDQLGTAYEGDPIFELHPAQLLGFLEAVWETWRRLGERSLAVPPGSVSETSPQAVVVALGNVDDTTALSESAGGVGSVVLSDAVRALLRTRDSGLGPVPNRLRLDVEGAVEVVLQRMLQPTRRNLIATPWPHLMYAYLIENTRVFEILAKVVQGSVTDEPFGTLSDRSFRWLRITEDLFFRDGPSSLVTSITSRLRKEDRDIRGNAYYRMFGIDLNHGAVDGGAYPYVKAQVANRDFVRALQELLRELWRGFINARNTSGARTTDDANIRELLTKLKAMMTARRLSTSTGGGPGRANLSREELVAVATLEWFDLTVQSDTPIVVDLKASGDTPEARLQNLAERVKLPSHGKSRSFFQLAASLPTFLREIEDGEWDTRFVGDLYGDVSSTNSVASRTTEIINHWSIATGVDLKSIPVATEPR